MTIFEEILIVANTIEHFGSWDKTKESESSFLKRLVSVAGQMSDMQWDSLSLEAQTWFNSAAVATNSEKPIPDCPGMGDTGREVKVKPQFASVTPIAPPKPKRRNPGGVVDAIRIAAIEHEHERLTAHQIYDILVKTFPDAKLSTIMVNIGDYYRLIQLARERGYWNDKPVKGDVNESSNDEESRSVGSTKEKS